MPVAGFEGFEFVAAGDGVEEDEVWQRRIELPDGMREHAAERGTRESGAVGVAALQQVDGLQVLGLRRLHAADYVQLIGNARTQGHERREVDAWQSGGDAAEWTAAGAVGFGVPGFELTRSAAEPEQDTVLLSALGFGGEQPIVEEAGEAGGGGKRSAGQTFEEQTAMHLMFIGLALPGPRPSVFFIHDRQGAVRNSALVTKAQSSCVERPY